MQLLLQCVYTTSFFASDILGSPLFITLNISIVFMRSEVLITMTLKNTVFGDVMPHYLVQIN